MSTHKSISLRKSVYEDLKDERRDNESFADTIERLLSSDETTDDVTVTVDTDEIIGRIDDLETELKSSIPDETASRFR